MLGVSMLNGRNAIVALKDVCTCTPQVSQTAYTQTDEPEDLPGAREVSTLSSLCANVSTLLASNVIVSTSYLSLLLFGVALPLD